MLKNYLEPLCRAFGPSGCEEAVAEVVRGLAPACFPCHTDRGGNLIYTYEPSRVTEDTKTVMISARMDEVGFMISEIDEEGYLRFSPLGKVNPRVLCGRNVLVGNEERRVMGVIASKAIHHQSAEERAKITPVDDMYIDIGAESRESAQKQVSMGDFGTFYGHFHRFGEENGFCHAKALDGRGGCAVLLALLRQLAEGQLQSPHRLHVCFTVRGEAGPSGAGLAAYGLRPDIAVVVGGAVAADLPDMGEAKRRCALGGGCVLTFSDEGTVYTETLVRYAAALAEKKGIPVQTVGALDGGRDASEIRRRGEGARMLALSIPVRYARTASSVICEKDAEATALLLSALLASPLSENGTDNGGQHV